MGGLAAVLHGASIVTADIDVVHRRTHDNIARLLGGLLPLHARARGDPRHLPPTGSALSGHGHILLDTDSGSVDVRCELGAGQDYDWLLPRSELIGRDARSVRVVTLSTRIELKHVANRPTDRLAIAILMATLDARTRTRAR